MSWTMRLQGRYTVRTRSPRNIRSAERFLRDWIVSRMVLARRIVFLLMF